jgi:hypothetical protein
MNLELNDAVCWNWNYKKPVKEKEFYCEDCE